MSLSGATGSRVRIQGQLAQQLTVLADDADVSIGDQQPDALALVRTADVDVPQLAEVGQRDAAAAVDLVLAHTEVRVKRRQARDALLLFRVLGRAAQATPRRSPRARSSWSRSLHS